MSFGGSRLGQNPVKLIGINAPFQPALQFGREHSADNDPRARAASAWGGSSFSGRSQDNGAITEPLPTRQQTAMSHQLSPQMQNMLRGGMKPLANQGRQQAANSPIELHSVHLGAAIGGSQKRQSTVSVCATGTGHMTLRKVSGDYNYQV